MPAIAMFHGIIIYMYFMDNKQHKSPHIHVMYQGQEVIVQIPNGEVLEGAMPNAKMKLLQAWIEFIKTNLWPTGRLQCLASYRLKLIR
jgi:hypothetical protein